MKKRVYILFLIFVISFTGFSKSKIENINDGYIKSKPDIFKLGALREEPKFDPRGKRVLKVFPEKGAIDYSKVKATSCDNSQYLPPVASQGGQNSCAAWAVGYYYKTYQENRENSRTTSSEKSDPDNICSPAFIYNLIHLEGDNGSYPTDAFDVLCTLGCCSLSDMPYDDSDYTTWPSTDAFKNAMWNRCQKTTTGAYYKYMYLDDDNDLNSLKQLLLNGGAAVFAINVYDNYYNISDYNNIYSLADKTGSNHGGHAQCIVGFDDNKATPDGNGAFLVVNSWGTGWGDNGFYWISYEAIKNGSDLSQGYVLWIDDKINYQPSYYALVNITHAYSRETQPYFTTSQGDRFNFFDFYVKTRNYEYLSYPSTDIAVDLSDLDISHATLLTFSVEDLSDVTNSEQGTINKFEMVNVATLQTKVSSDPPVTIAEDSTGSADITLVTTFFKFLGGASDDQGNAVIETSDNGIVVAGYSQSYTNGSRDISVYKYDSDGNKVWFKHFGGANDDEAYSIVELSDGSFVLTGYTSSITYGGKDVALYKLDSNGNKVWFKHFGGSGDEECRAIIQTSDGGFAATGYTSSTSGGDKDITLYKFDSDGNKQWFKYFGGSNDDEGYSLVQTNDGGYLVVGYTLSYTNGGKDVALYKLDSNGNVEWNKHLGGSNDEEGYSICLTSDGGYLISGYTTTYTAGGRDVAVYKFDSSNNKEWFKHLGGANDEEGYVIQVTSTDNGFIVCGYTATYTMGQTDIALWKFNSSNNKEWFNHLGGSNYEEGFGLFQTSTGGYAVTGYTTSYTHGSKDVALYKLDSNGHK